jgi:hypothetical protein
MAKQVTSLQPPDERDDQHHTFARKVLKGKQSLQSYRIGLPV